MFESIGPVWDGNEVWLVVAGARDLRRLPGLVRDAVLGLLPRAAARPLLPDRPRRLVRVAREERQPTLACRVDAVRTRSGASARRSSGASRSRICSTACRSTRTATSPGTSGICSASTPCSPAWRSSLFFAFHGAGFLTLRTTGDLCERAALTALAARGARRGVGAAFLVWTVVVAVDNNDKDVLPAGVLAGAAIAAVVLAIVLVVLAAAADGRSR